MTRLLPVPNSIPHISPSHLLYTSSIDFTSGSSPCQALPSLRDLALLFSLSGTTPFLNYPSLVPPLPVGLHSNADLLREGFIMKLSILKMSFSHQQLSPPPITVYHISLQIPLHHLSKPAIILFTYQLLYHPSLPLKYTLYKNKDRPVSFSTPSPELGIGLGYLTHGKDQ